MPDPVGMLRQVITAFSAHDEGGMRAALADDLTAYVSNAEGGVDRVHGRDDYVQRLLALRAPSLNVTEAQAVAVPPDQALLMVEIRAERNGKTLHKFSAFLARVGHDEVRELWMVGALPAYSDEFWR